MTPAQVYRIVTMAIKDNGTPSIETLRELERMQREEEELEIRQCRECPRIRLPGAQRQGGMKY